MARSRDAGHNNKRLYYIAVPVLALVISAAVYFVVSQPAQSCQNTTPIMNYLVQISIQVAGTNSTGGRGIQFVVPKGAGEATLMWNSHTYDAYGLDCKSPLYMDAPVPGQPYPGYSQIHVVSSIFHNYTLADFFDVWGFPIGQNNTINVTPSNGNQWSMCVGPSRGSQRPGMWGLEPLINYNPITLLYDNIGCL